ncbi:MAG: hypothetical protein H6668_25155 [Ardenticatenaceae bacterium]|nr:hypothetical protein [Ardenticatenaceae bacterium]
MGPSPLAMQSVTQVLSQVNTYPYPEMLVQLREVIAATWATALPLTTLCWAAAAWG